MVAAIVALWLAMYVKYMWHIVVSALVMGIAVCGMHYTGMMVVNFVHNLAVEAMDLGVVAFSIIVVAMAVVGANRNQLIYSK